MPYDWSKLYFLLFDAWIKNIADKKIPEPPKPLILAGTTFSTADAIRHRWMSLIKWANENGFSNLMSANMPPPPDYDVAEQIAGVSNNGTGWLGERRDYSHHDPKPKHNPEEVNKKLLYLKDHWCDIVGSVLAESTVPFKITGRKSRRLVVLAKHEALPPWGSWKAILKEKQSFTAFRKAINLAISPLEFDDISFVVQDINKRKILKTNHEERLKLMKTLQLKWPDIVDHELSIRSMPEQFFGRRYRTLIVKVIKGFEPSWGRHGFYFFSRNYTKLIESINLEIRPQYIHDVIFIETDSL